MATAHIESKMDDIAPVVLMPGDPLRAKGIAETFLEEVKQVNTVRNMFGYTGFYKGKKVTVFASGMGNASMAIYAYELYQFYHVDTIIRVGSIGSYQRQLKLFDLVLVENSFTTSNFAKQYDNEDVSFISSSKEVNEKIEETALALNQPIIKGNVHCSDAFYKKDANILPRALQHQCLGEEMETFALFYLANRLGKKAAAILTVSNSLVEDLDTTSEQREKNLMDMAKLALETVSNKF